jgi:hypothetical protein
MATQILHPVSKRIFFVGVSLLQVTTWDYSIKEL